MEIDLFADEQRIYDNALNRIAEAETKAAAGGGAVGVGTQFDCAEYAEITKEYGKLLKQLRRATRLADRTTFGLYESNLNLADKVHYDSLTGIYNRRYMEDNLKRVIKTIVRAGGGLLSVLMLDIDFFKKYNDTYGHSEGDVCLRSIAKVLAVSVMRQDDFAARYGGEEFVVVLPNTDENGACVMAKNILENVRACNIPHIKNEAASCVTVSIGVTTAHVNLERDSSDYIKRADVALYKSKETGRNKYTYLAFEEEKHEV